MFKSKMVAALTLMLTAVALLTTMSLARTAFAAGSEDVFMDEGDGDFDSMPAPPTQADAPVKKESVAVPKAPEPRPAEPVEPSSDMIPMLTDDAAPAATPAPTEDPSQPAAAQPKAKKAKKKKADKKAATASNEDGAPVPPEEPTHKAHKTHAASTGSFVTTKEACPMMRSPASTGETMLTVKASKKIWVEDAGDGWVKAFNKAGEPGYVSKDCVE